MIHAKRPRALSFDVIGRVENIGDADTTATRFERIYEELCPRRPSTPSARALEVS